MLYDIRFNKKTIAVLYYQRIPHKYSTTIMGQISEWSCTLLLKIAICDEE
jgi:hypothetical protein